MWKKTLNAITNPWILRAFGLLLCVVPPAWETIEYFPDWVQEGYQTTFSGIAVLLLAISILPLAKFVLQKIKSPSAWMVWVLIYVLLFSINQVMDEALVISKIGAISNVAGCALFYLARVRTRKKFWEVIKNNG